MRREEGREKEKERDEWSEEARKMSGGGRVETISLL